MEWMYLGPWKVASRCPLHRTCNLEARMSPPVKWHSAEVKHPRCPPQRVNSLPAWTSIQILMVTRLASGDAVVLAAEAALGDGDSEKAAQLLREAKSFYHHAQVRKDNRHPTCESGRFLLRLCLQGDFIYLRLCCNDFWPELVRVFAFEWQVGAWAGRVGDNIFSPVAIACSGRRGADGRERSLFTVKQYAKVYTFFRATFERFLPLAFQPPPNLCCAALALRLLWSVGWCGQTGSKLPNNSCRMRIWWIR